MTTIPKLATYNIPHRHHRSGEVIESFDCGIAPLGPEEAVIGQDETLPVPEGQYIEIEHDMSALGRDLFEFGARLSRAQAKGEL